jgi:hypothetical protein
LFLQDLEILSIAIGTWAHFHDLLPPLLFVFSWMFAFPQIMGCTLVLLSSHFLLFSFVPCWKAFMLSTVSNLFLQDATKIGLYLVTIFGKGIKFHLSFFIFCFFAFGTCKEKPHVQSF